MTKFKTDRAKDVRELFKKHKADHGATSLMSLELDILDIVVNLEVHQKYCPKCGNKCKQCEDKNV